MPKIQNIMTNIGRRVGHQSGLDVSSGRNSTTFVPGIVFRFYLVFSKTGKTLHIDKYRLKRSFTKKHVVFNKKRLRHARNPVSGAWGANP